MNTAIAAPLNPPSSDHYDPDEVVPRDSPLLQPTRVSLRLSPSPPPHIPLSQVSPTPSPGRSGSKSNRRPKVKPSQGDAVLISFMDGGKDPTIAALAGTEALPSDISDSSQHGETEDSRSDFDENDIEDLVATKHIGGSSTTTSREIAAVGSTGWDARTARGPQPQAHSLPGPSGGGSVGTRASINTPSPGNEPGHIAEADHTAPQAGLNEDKMAVDTPVRMPPRNEAEGSKTAASASKDGRGEGHPRPEENTSVALQSLAAGALGALRLQGPDSEPEAERTGRTPAHIDIALTRRIRALEPDMVATPSATLSPYSSTGVFSPRQSLHSPFSQADLRSPLPPIQGLGSPRSDTNSLLPSIREQLGDINSLGEQTPDGRHSSYAHSSPGVRLPGMPHGSPPISPNDMFRSRPGDMPSPSHPMQVSSPYAHYQQFSSAARNEYSSSATETPSTDQSTPSTTITDRMSIDGITNPLAGSFVCKVPGCTAAPFQTQYLLNSHANVHSSARPHYCPKKGCPRSEGGKGFKRKNEMIRHGLVHDSPGYVCPFCPDREHKYPRPDNLQRHVRVHHMDKEKDDPMLRDVLSQRPDGPSRGRRKRGPI